MTTDCHLSKPRSPASPKGRSLRPARVRRGLIIGRVIQVYSAERIAQTRFARHVAARATDVVDVGYGLGFAHRLFDSRPGLKLSLVEENEELLRQARRLARSCNTRFVLGRWQDRLLPLLTSRTTIYFDAFPVEKDFDYSRRAFCKYILPLLQHISATTWRECYFVSFDRSPLPIFSRGNMSVIRVFSLRSRSLDEKVGAKQISLYRAYWRGKRMQAVAPSST